jgi:cyclopropane-fatty-acyl-phospholipid synthase
VEFHLCDYRDFNTYNPNNKQFDKIVSIGLCEHIGYKNYPYFMQIAHQQLQNNGLFLLHTIGNNISVVNTEPWTSKYIFPNGMLPSIRQLGEAMENRFVMEDWHNIGSDYDKTLMAWHANFQQHWPKIAHKYDQRFYRMWVYYLLSCAGLFRSRRGQLWQIVLAKNGVRGGYTSVR